MTNDKTAIQPAPLALVAMLGLFGCCVAPAMAADANCERIVAATVKRTAAPAFHQRQSFGLFSRETVLFEGKLLMRDKGGGWAPSPVSLADIRAANRDLAKAVSACRRVGAETVDGIATEIFSFQVPGGDGKPVEAKVWIGSADGLPYREESPGAKSTTVYRGVQRPN